jgi:hypothetical protein
VGHDGEAEGALVFQVRRAGVRLGPPSVASPHLISSSSQYSFTPAVAPAVLHALAPTAGKPAAPHASDSSAPCTGRDSTS